MRYVREILSMIVFLGGLAVFLIMIVGSSLGMLAAGAGNQEAFDSLSLFLFGLPVPLPIGAMLGSGILIATFYLAEKLSGEK